MAPTEHFCVLRLMVKCKIPDGIYSHFLRRREKQLYYPAGCLLTFAEPINGQHSTASVLGFPDTSGDYRSLVSKNEPIHVGATAKMVGCCLAVLYDILHLRAFLASKLTLTRPLLLMLVAISCRALLLFGSFFVHVATIRSS